ncbi:MAG: LysM peptidoglycan-binding domain-containing protein [bacterium]
MLPDTPRLAASKGILRRGLLAVLLFAAALPVSIVFARVHTVEEGETLSSIAETYGISPDELAAQNGISDPDHIVVGQALHIGEGGPSVAAPSGRTHVVSAGETLSWVADYYGLALDELLFANGIDDPDFVYEGEILVLPTPHYVPAPLSRAQTEYILRSAADEFGVSESLILGLAWLESGWNQSMVSWTGAMGVMQLMPGTAEWGLEYLAPDATNWRSSTEDNARLGTAVFAHMLAQANWDAELALAFYYQGWRSIEIYGMFDDTYQYVANVMSLAAEFR